MDRIYIGEKHFDNNNQELSINESEEDDILENISIDKLKKTISYKNKTLKVGDTVKWSKTHQGRLIKVSRKTVTILTSKRQRRRLPVDKFVELNF